MACVLVELLKGKLENSPIASLHRIHGRRHIKVHSSENQGGRQRAEAVTKAGVLASGPAHKVDDGFDIRL